MRYADDIVLAFEDRRSAERLLDALGKQLGRYGLELHETKTRLVDFRPPGRLRAMQPMRNDDIALRYDPRRVRVLNICTIRPYPARLHEYCTCGPMV